MYMNDSPKIRYGIIAKTIERDDNLLNISYLIYTRNKAGNVFMTGIKAME